MRRWMIAGNWKMHNNKSEAVLLAKAIKEGTQGISGGDVVLAPPFTALQSVYETIVDSHVLLAAQNMYYEDKGAFTGEISPSMLKDIGCTYVIIGHSERRKYFHETDEAVNQKVKKSLATGIKPIVCVGETEDERNKGVTEFVVGVQVKKALYGIDNINEIVIAYEPVWAIGTGKNATPAEAEEVHRFIRNIIGDIYGEVCNNTRVLYGGSVTSDNIGELINMEDIDGALVGGASLKSEGFIGIIKKASEKKIMLTVIAIIHIVISIALIMIVLLQTGRGSEIGAAFGSGSSQTLFGSSGSSGFMTKLTTIAVVVFMLTSLVLAYLYSHKEYSLKGISQKEVPVKTEEKLPAQQGNQ